MSDKKTDVVVTIYTDGETHVAAPPDVNVTIQYESAHGDTRCKCCSWTIRRDDEGNWSHIDAPHYWGGDHEAEP